MAKLLKLRRGTTSQHSSFTGAEGEVTVDTDKDVLVVHDGSTAGGHPVAAQDMDNVPAGAILGTQLENSGVTAGQYGSSSAIPIVTVDAQGLVTAASTTAIDSTTIANGTSNVAVANNGNITTTRSGTTRLTVTNTGIDVNGDIRVPDDEKIMLGTHDDVQILHDPNNFYIKNYTGGLFIQGGTQNNSIYIRPKEGEDSIKANSNGSVEVFHDNAKKLETSSSGISVTGNVSVSGTVDGRDVAADGTKLDGIESGATADQSAAEILTAIKTVDGAGSGLDADTLDGISSGNFVRSDQGDTMSGQYTITTAANEKLTLSGSASPFIRFEEGTTDKAYIQWDASGGELIFVNQETNDYLRIGSGSNGLKYTYDGSNATVWHTGNDGSGSGLDADRVDGIEASNFLRSDQNDSATGDITFNGSASFNSGAAGAVSVSAGGDIRLGNGAWTGNSAGKIQHHDNYLWFQGGSNGFMFRDDGGTNRTLIDGNGNFVPQANNTYDLGTSSNRYRNIYTNDLNLSNQGSSNEVDGTWGDWTIQEGESDLFLKNNRSGKKYKFNLTEVS